MKYRHQIIVGNIGTVYEGNSDHDAAAIFYDYKEQSEATFGRASGESVTWIQDDEIHWYHPGDQETDCDDGEL